jgi:hypothetical protein
MSRIWQKEGKLCCGKVNEVASKRMKARWDRSASLQRYVMGCWFERLREALP